MNCNLFFHIHNYHIHLYVLLILLFYIFLLLPLLLLHVVTFCVFLYILFHIFLLYLVLLAFYFSSFFFKNISNGLSTFCILLATCTYVIVLRMQLCPNNSFICTNGIPSSTNRVETA